MCIYILQVQDIVDDYKNANLTISKNCKKISEMLLVKIDGKRVYDNLEFEEEQVNHKKILDVIRRLLSSLCLWVCEPVCSGSKSISQSIVSWSILPLLDCQSISHSFSQSISQLAQPSVGWYTFSSSVHLTVPLAHPSVGQMQLMKQSISQTIDQSR